MQLRYWTLLSFGCWAMNSTTLSAQHVHSAKCAVNHEMAAQIKAQLLANRARITPEQIAMHRAQRAMTYIPLTMHIVGDNSGNGYVDLDEVLDMICGLQKDYDDQEIQFYLNGQFRYINNTTLYNNAFSSGGGSVMNSNKVANSLNAFAGPSVNDPSASFYQPNWFGSGDYVFLLNAQLMDANQNTAPTTAHEFGHFFTLPHTFDGWESVDYDQTYAGANAPTYVGGVQVEHVARTNCAIAGDMFCDTPADYFSGRTPCPYTGVAKDPTGAQLDPDESNLMSYFYDACVNNFSTDQKDAIVADVISRGWTGFTPPATAVELTTAAVLTAPAANAIVNLASTSDITLTWDAMPNATGYYIEVDRSLFGSPIESIKKAVVYNTTTYTIPASLLQANRQYTWKVRPFNAIHTCPNTQSSSSFNTVLISGTDDLAEAAKLTMETMPNPVNGSSVTVVINTEKDLMGAIRLYGTDGKLLVDMANEALQSGANYFQIPTDMLSNGLYILTLTTEAGSSQQKIVIER